MSQDTINKSPGIRVAADGQRVGAVYGIDCPALEAEGLDVTPLDAGWRRQRPGRRQAGDLKLTMQLRAGDAGQEALTAAYFSGGEIPLALELPGGQRLTWRGWVRRLALRCAHPGAPVSLEAAVCVSGDMEVSA